MMFMLVTPAWAGTIVYDFEDESQLADWFEVPTLDRLPYIAQWSIEDGKLLGISNGPAMSMGQGFGVDNYTWSNYTVEAQFMIEEFSGESGLWGSAVFLVAHYHLPPGVTDPTQFWMVWLGPHRAGDNGEWQMFWYDGSQMPIEDIVPPFEVNRWYSARIECEDGHYRMFFDDRLLAEFDTETPEESYGVPGFAIRNCRAYFDNMIITGDDIPDMLSVAAVSPRSKLATTWGCIRK